MNEIAMSLRSAMTNSLCAVRIALKSVYRKISRWSLAFKVHRSWFLVFSKIQ